MRFPKWPTPSTIGTIKRVTAPNKWSCSICHTDISAGTKCHKQGSKIICDSCVVKESK